MVCCPLRPRRRRFLGAGLQGLALLRPLGTLSQSCDQLAIVRGTGSDVCRCSELDVYLPLRPVEPSQSVFDWVKEFEKMEASKITGGDTDRR